MSKPIAIIRHGETDLNAEDKIRGWLDVPLSNRGIKQVEKTGKKLKREKLDGIISSDMTRCVQTAGIVSHETGVPILGFTAYFRPWNVGYLTGTKSEEAHKILAVFAQEKPNEKVKDGESFNEFKDRFLKGVQMIKKELPDKKIAICTHHRGDKIMAAWEAKGEPDNLEIDLNTFLTEGIKPGDYRLEGEIKKEKGQEADYKPIKKVLEKIRK